ncbi:acyl carrier protein [Streptomyces piniterrae]|uniref:Acyl carrier protein n=1 Tax=Streptomyces piniterrae TaxID=2571125 RepID=A0A4U0NTH8_9ACTN|nr:acyl carrier protein [Streptomyces piniterrae]TJZ57352.1 acyl carrier protein [Streptomyces piniterrae]
MTDELPKITRQTIGPQTDPIEPRGEAAMPIESQEAEGQAAERQEILALVTTILDETLGIELGDDVDLNTSIGPEGIGIESIGILEVTVHLEREYNIEFADETLEALLRGTLGEFIDEVVKQRTAVATGASTENSGSW